MIPHGVEVFVALEPVDMRLGFDRLAGLAQERMQRSARCGALFLFFGKRRTALKILFFDGSGLCVLHKRLDQRRFKLPAALDGGSVVVIEERELDDLLEGINVEGCDPKPRRPRRPTEEEAASRTLRSTCWSFLRTRPRGDGKRVAECYRGCGSRR